MPFQRIGGNTIEVCSKSVLQESFALAGFEEPFPAESIVPVQTRLEVDELKGQDRTRPLLWSRTRFLTSLVQPV